MRFGDELHNVIFGSRVPGLDDNSADLKSRFFYDNKEWFLNPKMYELVCETFVKPTADLFATTRNSKRNKCIIQTRPKCFQSSCIRFKLE